MVDLRLEWLNDAEYFAQCKAVVTLRNGNKCWTPWVHQSRQPGWDCELRYASDSEAKYTHDGVYCGSNRNFDIIALERGISAEDAQARGVLIDWPGSVNGQA